MRRLGRREFSGSAEPGWAAGGGGGAGGGWGWIVMAGSRRLWALALGALPLPKGVRGRRTPKLLAGEGPAELFHGASVHGGCWLLDEVRVEGGWGGDSVRDRVQREWGDPLISHQRGAGHRTLWCGESGAKGGVLGSGHSAQERRTEPQGCFGGNSQAPGYCVHFRERVEASVARPTCGYYENQHNRIVEDQLHPGSPTPLPLAVPSLPSPTPPPLLYRL